MKTNVLPRSRILQGCSVRNKRACRAWDIISSSTNNLVGQPICLWGETVDELGDEEAE